MFQNNSCFLLSFTLQQFENQNNTKTESRKSFHALVYSLNIYNSQEWARLKSGAQNSIKAPHMNCKGPGNWTMFC